MQGGKAAGYSVQGAPSGGGRLLILQNEKRFGTQKCQVGMDRGVKSVRQNGIGERVVTDGLCLSTASPLPTGRHWPASVYFSGKKLKNYLSEGGASTGKRRGVSAEQVVNPACISLSLPRP